MSLLKSTFLWTGFGSLRLLRRALLLIVAAPLLMAQDCPSSNDSDDDDDDSTPDLFDLQFVVPETIIAGGNFTASVSAFGFDGNFEWSVTTDQDNPPIPDGEESSNITPISDNGDTVSVTMCSAGTWSFSVGAFNEDDPINAVGAGTYTFQVLSPVGTEIEEDDFLDADWSLEVESDPDDRPVTAAQVTGDEDDVSYVFRRITTEIYEDGELAVDNLYTAESHDPATNGPIAAVRFRYWARLETGSGGPMIAYVSPYVEQGGRHHQLETSGLDPTTAPGEEVTVNRANGWRFFDLQEATADDFLGAAGMDVDFSETGAPIHFGLRVRFLNSDDWQSTSGDVPVTIGLDEFRVSISTTTYAEGACFEEVDECPDDIDKTEPGECGCGVADVDLDDDGIADCNDECLTFHGAWSITTTDIESTGCPADPGPYTDIVTIDQFGCTATVTGLKGFPDEVEATIVGGTLTAGPHEFMEEGGRTTSTHVFQFQTLDTLEGEEQWSFSGSANCTEGTAHITGEKLQ